MAVPPPQELANSLSTNPLLDVLQQRGLRCVPVPARLRCAHLTPPRHGARAGVGLQGRQEGDGFVGAVKQAAVAPLGKLFGDGATEVLWECLLVCDSVVHARVVHARLKALSTVCFTDIFSVDLVAIALKL